MCLCDVLVCAAMLVCCACVLCLCAVRRHPGHHLPGAERAGESQRLAACGVGYWDGCCCRGGRGGHQHQPPRDIAAAEEEEEEMQVH